GRRAGRQWCDRWGQSQDRNHEQVVAEERPPSATLVVNHDSFKSPELALLALRIQPGKLVDGTGAAESSEPHQVVRHVVPWPVVVAGEGGRAAEGVHSPIAVQRVAGGRGERRSR